MIQHESLPISKSYWVYAGSLVSSKALTPRQRQTSSPEFRSFISGTPGRTSTAIDEQPKTWTYSLTLLSNVNGPCSNSPSESGSELLNTVFVRILAIHTFCFDFDLIVQYFVEKLLS